MSHLLRLFEGSDGNRTDVAYLPAISSRSPARIVRHVVRREVMVIEARRRARRGRVPVRRDRLRPTQRRTRRFAPARVAALGGLLVRETGEREDSAFDAITAEIGLESIDRLAFGSGGAFLAFGRLGGRRVVVRVGVAGSPGDPMRPFGALVELSAHPLVPSPVSSCRVEEWSCTVERTMEGKQPGRDVRPIARDVAEFLSGLPRGSASARLGDHSELVHAALPSRSRELAEVLERIGAALEGVPGVLGHGDLWGGNVLVRAGRLSGVIDWDAWSPDGVPGVDLLHLLATAERHRRGVSLGRVWLSRPWEEPGVRAHLDAVLAAHDIDPTSSLRWAIGAAWWIGQVGGDLYRDPSLARSPVWVRENLTQVLDRLSKHP